MLLQIFNFTLQTDVRISIFLYLLISFDSEDDWVIKMTLLIPLPFLFMRKLKPEEDA